MDQHLIFMDIDGTLVNDQQQISKKTREVIIALQQKGHQFYVATGRKYSSAVQIAKNLSDATQVVASNGSVYSLDQTLFKEQLSAEALRQIYEVAAVNSLPIFFFGEHTIFYTQQLPEYLQENDRSRVGQEEEDFFFLDSWETLFSVRERIVNGIVIADNRKEELIAAREKLAASQLLTISSSHPNNIELIPLGISKATAIQAIQQHWGLPKERIISFGDGLNDLEMLQASGISVAMGNAIEELKQHATFVTDTNLEDGLANFLINYFELKE